jgi:hypothetical protein
MAGCRESLGLRIMASAVKEATNVTAGLGITPAKFHRCTVDPRTDSERSTPVMCVGLLTNEGSSSSLHDNLGRGHEEGSYKKDGGGEARSRARDMRGTHA